MLTCHLYVHNNPQPHIIPPSLLRLVHYQKKHPGENRPVYFTQMTLQLRYKYLLEFADTFMWWAGAFPTPTKKATKVCKSLLKEISSKLVQSDSKFSLIAKITQGLSRALETGYNLHTSW